MRTLWLVKPSALYLDKARTLSHTARCLFVVVLFYKRNKKTCSSCIVELYKHLGIIKNTQEVREASLCISLLFLKIPVCLYISTMHSGVFFISLSFEITSYMRYTTTWNFFRDFFVT